jgi:hypothetical protein
MVEAQLGTFFHAPSLGHAEGDDHRVLVNLASSLIIPRSIQKLQVLICYSSAHGYGHQDNHVQTKKKIKKNYLIKRPRISPIYLC